MWIAGLKATIAFVQGVVMLAVGGAAPVAAQSGAAGAKASGRAFGVNLTLAIYQFDETRSKKLEPITRLSSTFSTPADEIAHLKDKFGLEDIEVRHVRPVGLKGGESFNDAVQVESQYLVISVTPVDVVRGQAKFDLKIDYGNQTLLDAKRVEIENFETVVLLGGKSQFGLKYFIGAGGRRDSVPAERTLLASVTAEIVPTTSLRDRPEQMSQPVDANGSPILIKDGDRFTPPVPVERVVPKFETGRAVAGTVTLAGIVSPDGKVTNIRVVRSIEPAIDDRAVEAFRQYRFSPGLLNGQPVHSTYRESLAFAPPKPTLLEIQRELEDQRREKEKEKKKKP